jgi:MraZ protein
VFLSEYRHNIDAKGRLSIPAEMRNECGEVVYVTKGNDGCLSVYTEQGWLHYYEEIIQLSQKKAKARKYIRTITSKVKKCEFDKLGRINIPLNLRELAHLEKECVITGAGDHIEIWNSTLWDEYMDGDDDFDELTEELDEE